MSIYCIEKTQIQALGRAQPILPLKEKVPKRLTATYKRNGTVGLIAALAVRSGEITAKPVNSNKCRQLSGFFEKVGQDVQK